MTRLMFLFLSLFFIGAGPVLASSGGQIAAVDLQRAVSESKEGMAARADLLKKTEQFNADLKVMLAEIEKSRAEFEKVAPTLSVEERAEKELALQKKGRDFQNRQREAQEELKQLESDHLKKLLAKFRVVMAKMGEEDHYAVILDRSVGVFYTGKEIDITAQLIQRADKDYGRR